MKDAIAERPVLINAGCGPSGAEHTPRLFEQWRHLRVDVDPNVKPDVIADVTDMSALADNSADALWTSHCIEHLYRHQVPLALREFRRVLKNDGFAIIIVPDIQAVARYVADDKLSDVLYESSAGPITPHDVFFGLGTAVAAGNEHMAHKCAFTPKTLFEALGAAGFPDFVIRRREKNLELAAVARKTPWPNPDYRNALLDALML